MFIELRKQNGVLSIISMTNYQDLTDNHLPKSRIKLRLDFSK